MANNDLLTAIDQAVAALKAARKTLASTTKQAKTTSSTNSSPKKPLTASAKAGRVVSEEGRARMAEAQRKRWAAKKKADRKAARAAA